MPGPGERLEGLQVLRPVVGGETDFLDKARFVGAQVLGDIVTTSIHGEGIVVPDSVDQNPDEIEWMQFDRPVGRPALDVFSAHDLCVTLLQRVAPADYASRFSFPYHLARLTSIRRPWRPIRDRVPSRRGKLYDVLDEMSERAGFASDSLVVDCDHIELVGPRLLALGLDAASGKTRLLQRQAAVSRHMLAQNSKRAAYPQGRPAAPNIPFAEVPRDVSDGRYSRLVDGIRALLPIKLVLGPPTHPQPR